MATDREDIINTCDTLPARYNIGFSEIEVDPEPIAEGIFGPLLRGRWRGRAIAVKKFDLDNTDDNFNLAAKEMERMIYLRHPNVLKVHGFYFVAEPCRVLKCSMVMELMEFDLDKYIKLRQGEGSPLTDNEVIYIMAEIARGMKHVHEKRYSHRDLKPQNVLIRRSPVLTSSHLDVKVADFGSSELMNAGQFDRKAGTSGYRAPEQFSGDASCQRDKLDVYSFGCICFKLWTGEDPPLKNHAGLMERWNHRDAQKLPGGVEGIITKCLDEIPDARPGFREISNTLDAVLKQRQVEQPVHPKEVTLKEEMDLAKRRRKIVKDLGLDGGENGLDHGENVIDFADYVILPEEIVVRRKIADGIEGSIYEVDYKGNPCALKVFLWGNIYEDSPGLKMLPKVIHKNIVRFLGYSVSTSEESGMVPSILMQLVAYDLRSFLCFPGEHTSGTLFSFEPERRKIIRWKIMKGIAEGMKFLHDNDWVHGDLKPWNVLVDVLDQTEDANDIVVKLIDFCLMSRQEWGGASRYAAPEVLQARTDQYWRGKIDPKKADVYSFAITCSDILGKDEENFGFGRPSKFKMGVIGGTRPRLPGETSQKLQDLITRCWSPDFTKRPSFDDICDFFSQPMPVEDCKWYQNPCTFM